MCLWVNNKSELHVQHKLFVLHIETFAGFNGPSDGTVET